MVKKAERGSLFVGVLENISSDYFEVVSGELRGVLRKKPGVYALYKGDKLYYVGLARSLYGRVKSHKIDRNKGHWNRFSILIVKDAKHLKDIETAMVRIAKPKGNKLSGRIHRHRELERVLRGKIKEKKRKMVHKKIKVTDEKVKELKLEIKQIESALAKK